MVVQSTPPPTETDALLPKQLADDPELQRLADDDVLDSPKIPGAKIQYILPALGLGVSSPAQSPHAYTH